MDSKMKRMTRGKRAERSRSRSASPGNKRRRSSSSSSDYSEEGEVSGREEVQRDKFRVVSYDCYRSKDKDSDGRHGRNDRDKGNGDWDGRFGWERNRRDRRDRSSERDRYSDRNRRDRSPDRDRYSNRNRIDRSPDRDRVDYRNRRERSPDRNRDRRYNRDTSRDRESSRKGGDEGRGEKNDGGRKKPLNGEETLTTRTGGAYIPPAKLRMLQAQIADKNSAEYQRISWEALKKSIHGLINKINTNNIGIIVRELLRENVVRGRGLLARSIMQAQAFSPTFTHVYAALTAIINSKFPETGELILRRLIVLFRRSYRRNDKQLCMTSARFIGHLANQQVAHELVALEILTLLLENPTDDSVEVAIGFLKESGMKLSEVTPRGVHSIFDRLRSILHEGQLDKRVQYMIEVMFAIRKDGFKDHPAVLPELDLVEENDQYTHLITLEDATNPDDILNVFKFDPEYEVNEQKYGVIRKEILDESSSGSEGGSSGSESEAGDGEDGEEGDGENQEIIDSTETNLVALRRTIYLTIQSSLDFEECAHKLLKLELQPGEIIELCHMILDCCAQQRTYEKFYGLLAQRFCQLNKVYVEPYQEIFKSAYDTIHRFETNKLRNVGKFFAHLLYTDAISWLVLSNIRLNEEDTTSSSRIFIKILFQELCEYMGLPKLNDRVKDITLQEAFDGIFPRDNPRNTRFAINFFTSIGLGGLTDDLREHLKNVPKPAPAPLVNLADSSSSSESDDESVEEVPLPKKSKHKKKKKKSKR